jgi:hypothetical protein
MHLVPNAAAILKHAWSVRLWVLSVVFGIADAVLPYLQDAIPDSIFKVLSLITAIGGLAARFIPQRTIPNGNDQK